MSNKSYQFKILNRPSEVLNRMRINLSMTKRKKAMVQKTLYRKIWIEQQQSNNDEIFVVFYFCILIHGGVLTLRIKKK